MAVVQGQAKPLEEFISVVTNSIAVIKTTFLVKQNIVLLLKGHCHSAHVLANGCVKDCKGKLHLAPEHWLETIFCNNIPVSSTYAWNKVRDQAALMPFTQFKEEILIASHNLE